MKTIIIAGGGRKAGKTTLAAELGNLLPDSKVVKLGHHPAKEGKPELYFQTGIPFWKLARAVGPCRYLIIESGAILDDPDLSKDLVIYLPARDGSDKPGAHRRRAASDIIRGEPVENETRERLREQLGVSVETFDALLAAVGAAEG